MAKINEDMVVIKVSELLRENDEAEPIMDSDFIGNIEAVVQELVGAGKLIEIIRE